MKKARAPDRQSELGFSSAASGAGIGRLTGLYDGLAIGLTIFVNFGPSPTSDNRVITLHALIDRAIMPKAVFSNTILMIFFFIHFCSINLGLNIKI